MLKNIINTDQAKTTIIIRVMVGMVFLSEGLQKFLFPAIRGTGRFTKIGLPNPIFLGDLVGTFEILCGILILLGILTRLASSVTLVIMITALVTTKLKIFINDGFWVMVHGARTDYAMLLGSIFLIIKGGGYWSVDRTLSKP
ncbi:DoxX family protein [Postechiella marina]|uniref:DoxX family protein n=1 Tax=Postechiella marina TaxID=943941 RepID=A0ABP8CHX6_9FLAO